MRSCLRRTLLQRSQRAARPCLVCDRTQSVLSRTTLFPLPSEIRSYSDDKKPAPEDIPGVESTGTVPDDPDIITTEAPEIQQPPSSPIPPSSVKHRNASNAPQQPWSFRALDITKKMDSATRARELTKAISHTSLRKKLHWYPPRKGINPAYDMALEFLHRDRENKKAAIERIEKRIARVKNGIFNPLVKITIDGGNAERLTELENARYQLMILRDINAPEVRWRFKQGDIDLRLATHQYLYRQNWESGQYYGKLMQRLETMKIIPDSLPTLKPKVDFRLRFWEKKYPSRVRRRTNGWRDTEAGELLPSASLMKPPRMEIIPHHREWWLPKKYTVVMLDLDVPDVENDSFKAKLHWMVKDIVASPTKSIIQTGNGKTVVPYLPPHPFRGMKYHRYPILVFEQPADEWLATRDAVFQEHKLEALQQTGLRIESTDTTSTEALASKLSPLLSTMSTTTGIRAYTTDSKPRSKYDWSNLDRDTFSIRAWANQMGMKPVGAHLVRCEWDENVPSILQSYNIPERAFKKIKSQECSPQ